jgi:hypothetical protein
MLLPTTHAKKREKPRRASSNHLTKTMLSVYVYYTTSPTSCA